MELLQVFHHVGFFCASATSRRLQSATRRSIDEMVMENLAITVDDGFVLLDPEVHDFRDVLSQAVSLCVTNEVIPVEKQAMVIQELLDRHGRVSTAIGRAVAIPHAYLDGITRPAIVTVRLKIPLDLGATDGKLTRFVFVLVGPPDHVDDYLDTLLVIARLMNDDNTRNGLRYARSIEEVVETLRDYGRRLVEKRRPVETEITPGLTYSGWLGGGVANDVRRRLKHYVADFRDGIHPKSVTATLFLFFACLAPAVTFGALMFGVTGGAIGATEMLVATAFCGVFYAIFAGQPLIILGGTGPLLVFTGILYQLCQTFELPFLESYAWVGLWTGAFTLLLGVTDASCLIRLFTRFTDEIFAALISIIFIVEAVRGIAGYIEEARAGDFVHDAAFLSLIMAIGTFAIAMLLSKLRSSRYLVPTAREFLSDFGPTLALVLMILFGMLFTAVKPEPLDVPLSFGTTTGRDWLVPLTNAPVWVWFAAAGPALLATILIYLDQNITARLINSPDNKLKKGEAYHLDLSIVGILTVACSMFGLPWLVAATVRSLNHLRSLATVEDSISPSGERRDEIVYVRENRVTGLAIHLAIGASLLMLPMLQSVPKAVLYGLFLYMGVVSITGNQFFERIGLWLMDSELYPRTHYIRRVPNWTIHKFTLLQVICLVILWVVKVSMYAILFPIFIALLVPVRAIAGQFFAPEHLEALDAEQLPAEEESDWA